MATASSRTPPTPLARQSRLWLTTPQMARLLDVHPKTLLKYANARRVPSDFARLMGSRWRWRADFAELPVFLGVPAPTAPVHPGSAVAAGERKGT